MERNRLKWHRVLFFFLVQEIYWESGERESQRVKGSLGGGQTDRQENKRSRTGDCDGQALLRGAHVITDSGKVSGGRSHVTPWRLRQGSGLLSEVWLLLPIRQFPGRSSKESVV